VSSTGLPQGWAHVRIAISRAPPPNVPRASGRGNLFRGIGNTSCFFADGDGSRSGAAGAGASSQAATPGGDGGNSAGRPRAAQKSWRFFRLVATNGWSGASVAVAMVYARRK